MRVEFEWAIAPPGDESPNWTVRERLVGDDNLVNFYPAPTQQVAEAIIKARRAFVHRTITTRAQAVQIFEPRSKFLLQ